MMVTLIETAKDKLTALRVYHRAGTTSQGPDTRYSWTHLPDKKTRAACTACSKGTIPEAVKAGTYREPKYA